MNIRNGAFLTMAVLAWGGSLVFADCRYSRVSEELAQCRPIDLIEGAGGGAAGGEVLAKVVCHCGYAADSSQCPAGRQERPSFTLPTSDILATCGQGERLCDSACPSTLSNGG